MAAVQNPERFKRNADGTFDVSAPPPFTIQDVRNAIPEHCWKKNALRSISYCVFDFALVAAFAFVALKLDSWYVWPVYWFVQGTMFWALFVVGHDCGHGSFSDSRLLNYFLGHVTHSFIMVPFHGWRISHRTHHANHGHVGNDESWYPLTKSQYKELSPLTRMGRLEFPLNMLAYPFYLLWRSPGKDGSHYDPNCNLFAPDERGMVLTSDACMLTMICVLFAGAFKLGVASMLKLYLVPYLVFVVWLDVVTYLHHHGVEREGVKVPWYRGKEWTYLRGGLSTLDHDYGIFNNWHHNIGTHVVHHLFPAIPHYHLKEATEAVKPLLGPYYREPTKCTTFVPLHLFTALVNSFAKDHYVDDDGDVIYYKRDPTYISPASLYLKAFMKKFD